MRKLTIVALLLLISTWAFGQQVYTMGDTHYTYSTQTQPAKGASFTDSTYHIPVTRVTNSATDGGGQYGTMTEYPSFDPSSSDGADLLVVGCATQAEYQSGNNGCNHWQLYNESTYAWVEMLSNCSGGASAPGPLCYYDSQASEPRWNRGSYTAHAFTYRKYMTLHQYNVDTSADTIVHNFMSEFGPSGSIAHLASANSDTSNTGWVVFCNEYCSPSTNGRYYGFLLANCPNGCTYYQAFVYDRQTDTVISHHDITGANTSWGLKGLLLSPSGNYVIINYFSNGDLNTNEYSGQTAYTQDFSSYVRTSSYPDHVNFGKTAQGHEVALVSPAGSDYMSMVRLDTGQDYELYSSAAMGYPFVLWYYQDAVAGWGFSTTADQASGSPTWNAETQYGPGQIFAWELNETKCLQMFSVFSYTPLNPTPPSQAYGRHNPQACVTSNNRLWRIAFDQNAIGSATISYYFMQVNPQINYAGTKIWFGSNWRSVNNPSEVYEIDLPATWANDLNGSGATGSSFTAGRFVGVFQ